MRAALLLLCLLAGPGLAQSPQETGHPVDLPALAPLLDGQVTLDLSGLAPSQSMVWVEIQTAALPMGSLLILSSPGTLWQQSLVAFGASGKATAPSYQVAVPRGTAGTSLTLQVQIGRPDGAFPRPATAFEVLGITLLPGQ